MRSWKHPRHERPSLLTLRSLLFGALSLTIVLGIALGSSAQTAAEFAVVINEENPTSTLTANELSRIFMKKTKAWGDGSPIHPVDLGGASKTRKAFSVVVHGRSASAVKNNWQRRVFTGRGTPPPELQSEDDVVAYVRFNRGAIGYISTATARDGVRTVSLTD